MARTKDKVKNIKSKLEVIKKINDDSKGTVDNIYDKYVGDLSKNVFSGKRTDDFLDKRKTKNDNDDNIFEQIIDIAESFIGNYRSEYVNEIDYSSTTNVPKFKSKLKNAALDSAEITIESSKEIVASNIKKAFFASDGICGTDTTIINDTVKLSPREFDFLNILKIDPSTSVGKVVYEPDDGNNNRIKFNRVLYEQFANGLTPYQFDSITNNTLFTMTWDDIEQEYTLSGLTASGLQLDEFFNEYYSSIEYPDFEYIIKTAMMLSIQGDGSEAIDFKISLNFLDRLLDKLFSICSSSTTDVNNLSPVNNFNENDKDIEFFFDFNNVEGIDIDSEEDRLRGVLKFKDCDNIEVPVNPLMIEQFVYFSDKKDIRDLIDSTLNRVATDARSEADSRIPDERFIHFILNKFILQVPKAIVLSVLTPKIFLPIVAFYKLIKQNSGEIIGEIKETMKAMWKLFYNIIKALFWKFIREFWKFIKKELIVFISKLIKRIINNLLKRYRNIISSLINILTKILESGVDNCEDLFELVLQTISGALSVPTNINVPSILLSLAGSNSGYSQDRALMNISERLEAGGISLAPIFGEDNDIPLLVKSIIDGHIEEMDTNSYVKVSNQTAIIPNYPSPVVIPQGYLNITGKIF